MNKLDKKLRRMRRRSKILDGFSTLFFISNFLIGGLNIRSYGTEKMVLVVTAICLSIMFISAIVMLLTLVIKCIDNEKLFEKYKEITVREGEFEELLFFAPNATFLQGPDIDDKVLIIGIAGASIEKREMSKETAKRIFCDLTED